LAPAGADATGTAAGPSANAMATVSTAVVIPIMRFIAA
jgi:hypothetical protein